MGCVYARLFNPHRIERGSERERERDREKAFTRGCKYTASKFELITHFLKFYSMSSAQEAKKHILCLSKMIHIFSRFNEHALARTLIKEYKTLYMYKDHYYYARPQKIMYTTGKYTLFYKFEQI